MLGHFDDSMKWCLLSEVLVKKIITLDNHPQSPRNHPKTHRESTRMVIAQQFHAPATRSARKPRRERADRRKKFLWLKFCTQIIAMRHLDLKMRQKTVVNKVKKLIFLYAAKKNT